MSYTISLIDIINQIWLDGHEEEKYDTLLMPKWDNYLTKLDEKIDYAIPKIFSFDFPCYGDEDDKLHLQRHILNEYLTRDICCSSITRWQLFLRSKLNDIMPRYIPMYNANLKLIESAIDVLNPYHITEDKKRSIKATNTDSSTSTNSTTSEDKSSTQGTTSADGTYTDNTTNDTTTKFSDTPQALMQTGKDYLTNLTKANATNENTGTTHNTGENSVSGTTNSKIDGTGTVSTTSNQDKSDDYIKTIKGNMSKFNQGELVKAYQDSIINIEELVTKDLADLFYLMY